MRVRPPDGPRRTFGLPARLSRDGVQILPGRRTPVWAQKKGATVNRMTNTSIPSLVAGAAAGMIASSIQAAVGKTGEQALLPPREDMDLAPVLVGRVAEYANVDVSDATRWILGTGFHYGYGAFWGAAYAAVHHRTRVPPVVGGLALGGLIHAITFPRWGGAVRTHTVPAPRKRTLRMELVLASVTCTFGLTVSFAYEWLRPRDGERGHRSAPADERV